MSELFQTADNNTELDPVERLQLIPSLTTRVELNQAERFNINEARIWAMRPKALRRDDLITDAFSRELHRRMFMRVWRWAGKYRTTERNIGWEVPRITEGVRNAFDDAQAWLEHATFALPEIAVRLHHRLVAIHPWPNGNGRHARLLADLVVASRGGPELSWGAGADLLSAGEIRTRYIAAVKTADAGDMATLVAFATS